MQLLGSAGAASHATGERGMRATDHGPKTGPAGVRPSRRSAGVAGMGPPGCGRWAGGPGPRALARSP